MLKGGPLLLTKKFRPPKFFSSYPLPVSPHDNFFLTPWKIGNIPHRRFLSVPTYELLSNQGCASYVLEQFDACSSKMICRPSQYLRYIYSFEKQHALKCWLSGNVCFPPVQKVNVQLRSSMYLKNGVDLLVKRHPTLTSKFLRSRTDAIHIHSDILANEKDALFRDTKTLVYNFERHKFDKE